jgi:ABC-type nickel/cobalt efflux system permease component RcnA
MKTSTIWIVGLTGLVLLVGRFGESLIHPASKEEQAWRAAGMKQRDHAIFCQNHYHGELIPGTHEHCYVHEDPAERARKLQAQNWAYLHDRGLLICPADPSVPKWACE